MKANWYIVKLVFSLEEHAANIPERFDEQWRMLEASGSEEAFTKATQIGLAESEVIARSNGSKVEWKFLTITDIYPFNAKQDGAEVFSRIEIPDNANNYRQSMMAKAERFIDINERSELIWSLES